MQRPALYQAISDARSAWIRDGYEVFSPAVARGPDPYFTSQGKELLCFSSNNYLGLSFHGDVIQAAIAAVAQCGVGTCESRSLGGNLSVLEALEERIARFKQREDAVVFGTGLLANVGVIPALLRPNPQAQGPKSAEHAPLVIGDRLNHYSIVMGVRLSGAEYIRYDHGDMAALERILSQNAGRPSLILTDTIFSMDGDLAPLPRLCDLADEYNAMIMIDDAHGTGVLGATGRGGAEHFDVASRIHVHMGTLSKALGGMGGFIASEKPVADVVRNVSPTYYFTSSLPPEQAAGLLAAFDVLEASDELREALWSNTFRFHVGLRELGLVTPSAWTHIIPVMIGDETLARSVEQFMVQRGIYVTAVTFPAVAPGQSRLRYSITAMHSQADVDMALNALEEAARLFKLPVTPCSRSQAVETLLAAAPPYLHHLVDVGRERMDRRA